MCVCPHPQVQACAQAAHTTSISYNSKSAVASELVMDSVGSPQHLHLGAPYLAISTTDQETACLEASVVLTSRAKDELVSRKIVPLSTLNFIVTATLIFCW